MDWRTLDAAIRARNGWLLPALQERYGEMRGRTEFERLVVEGLSQMLAGVL